MIPVVVPMKEVHSFFTKIIFLFIEDTNESKNHSQ